MDHPFLSIVMPTFNAAGVLRTALESIVTQHFSNYELWVVDGCSTDETISIVKEYQHKHDRIYYISEKDAGIYDAMNKGAKLTSGKWLYFMGSDDRLYDEQVLDNFYAAARNGKKDFIYGDVLMKENNQVYGGRFSFHRLLTKNICHQAIFLKKAIFDEYGPFNTEYKVLADHDLNLKLFKQGVKTKYIRIFIAVFGAEGYSSTYYDTVFVKRFEEIYKEYSKSFFNRLRIKLGIMMGNYKKSGM